MALVRRTDITSQALRRLIPALWGKPRIAALLASWTDEWQEIEDAIFDVIDFRLLDNATGTRLRVLARLVGQKNFGWSDADLRSAIRARIRANRSNGRPQDLKDVLRLLLPEASFRITELAPATVRIDVTTPTDLIREAIIDILSDTRRGGVKLILNVKRGPDAFTWKDAAASSDPNLGWSDGLGLGGYWNDAIKA